MQEGTISTRVVSLSRSLSFSPSLPLSERIPFESYLTRFFQKDIWHCLELPERQRYFPGNTYTTDLTW